MEADHDTTDEGRRRLSGTLLLLGILLAGMIVVWALAFGQLALSAQ